MNFLIVTDLHLTSIKPASRLGDFVSDVNAKLQEVVEIAHAINAEAVLCAGDLFHRPDVSYSVVDRFLFFLEQLGIPFITIAGSHDLFGNSYASLPRTAIGILNRLSCITLLQEQVQPTVTIKGCKIGVENAGADIELVHKSVLPYPDNVGDYTLLDQYDTKAKVVVVGHYHCGYDLTSYNNCLFVCPGSLVRVSATASEILRRPRVAILEYNNTISCSFKELETAKPGESVLQPPVALLRPDFSEFVNWQLPTFNFDVTDLLYEFGTRELLKMPYIEYAISLFREKGGR